MFPEIRDFVYPTREEAKLHIKLLKAAFLNKNSLGVDEYYELMGIEPIPEEAHWYFWPDQSYFLFGRDEEGYHVKALDPIRVNENNIEEDENEQSGN